MHATSTLADRVAAAPHSAETLHDRDEVQHPDTYAAFLTLALRGDSPTTARQEDNR